MPTRRFIPIALIALFASTAMAAVPATQPVGKLPHIEVDVHKREVRVECQAVKADYPLEFLTVMANTNEYEALLSTIAKPSDMHLALLMLGLKPGQAAHYSESTQTWFPPTGPPVQIWVEWDLDGQHQRMPVYRWMRDVKTKKEAAPMAWVFTGSRTSDDGSYAADSTGYLVSVLNNELAVLDVPILKSRAMESREWERNSDLMPPTGTPVTMVLSPAGGAEVPATQPGAATTDPYEPGNKLAPFHLSDVQIDQQKVDHLKQYWQHAVAPHKDALREAAEAHYAVIGDLRREQQRLINEADRIQRTIDELEKEYQDMTTPRPEPTTQP